MTDSLAAAVADFLAHKRALGRKYHTEEATLRLLLAFTGQHGVEGLHQLTPCLFDVFVASRPRARARSFNHLVGVVSCFLDWAVAQQRLKASPLRRARRHETDLRLPFLFDVGQASSCLMPPRPCPTIRGPLAAARPTTPSSPCATDWGCVPGRRAAFASATSTLGGSS
jgi:site-specific recombinase XerC